jgi:hypothetical protein
MTEAQAEETLKELRIITVCVIILTVIIALAPAKATFDLERPGVTVPAGGNSSKPHPSDKARRWGGVLRAPWARSLRRPGVAMPIVRPRYSEGRRCMPPIVPRRTAWW